MSFVASFKQCRRIFKDVFKIHNNQKYFSSYCCLFNGLKSDLRAGQLHHRCFTSETQYELADKNGLRNKLFEFHNEWPTAIRDELLQDMLVIEDFATEDEETSLCAEAQKCMKRMRYQYDHWDDAIHGYREMEKADWSSENEQIFKRVRNKAFVANVLPHVHILDLAADGIIKPHVDSSRYCGSTIAGLSLLTDCIMRLRRVDEEYYKQNPLGKDSSTSNEQIKQESKDVKKNEFNYFVDILLKRRSLYVMKDSARYKFTHEVLPNNSQFRGNEIAKGRRISIICRNQA